MNKMDVVKGSRSPSFDSSGIEPNEQHAVVCECG